MISFNERSEEPIIVPPALEGMFESALKHEQTTRRRRAMLPDMHWFLIITLLLILIGVTAVKGQHYVALGKVHTQGTRYAHLHAEIDLKELMDAVHSVSAMVDMNVQEVSRAKNLATSGLSTEDLIWFNQPGQPHNELPHEWYIDHRYHAYEHTARMHAHRCLESLRDILSMFLTPEEQQGLLQRIPNRRDRLLKRVVHEIKDFQDLSLHVDRSSVGPQARMLVFKTPLPDEAGDFPELMPPNTVPYLMTTSAEDATTSTTSTTTSPTTRSTSTTASTTTATTTSLSTVEQMRTSSSTMTTTIRTTPRPSPTTTTMTTTSTTPTVITETSTWPFQLVPPSQLGDRQHTRAKRDLLSLLVGGFDAGLGLWNRHDINANEKDIWTIRSNQHKLLVGLKKASLKINLNLENVRKLREVLLQQVVWDKKQEFFNFVRDHFDSVLRTAMSLRLDLDSFAMECLKLISGHPPLGLFAHGHLDEVVEGMVKHAHKLGYFLHTPLPTAMVSYFTHGTVLHVDLKLPFVKRTVADIFKYVNAPLTLHNTTMHAFLSDRHHLDKLLVVSEDRTKAVLVNERDFRDDCKVGSEHWRCRQPFLLSKDPERICLARLLFFQNMPPRPVCDFQLDEPRPFALLLHHVVYLWGEKMSVNILCSDSSSQHSIDGHVTLPLRPGCRLVSEHFDLVMPDDDLSANVNISMGKFLQSMIKIERNLQLSEIMMQELTQTKLNQILHEVRKVKDSSPLDTEDIDRALSDMTEKDSSNTVWIIAVVALVAVALLVAALCAFLAFKLRKGTFLGLMAQSLFPCCGGERKSPRPIERAEPAVRYNVKNEDLSFENRFWYLPKLASEP